MVRWTDACYDCFAPTVGSYVLSTALLKASGDLYACAAFNVPERLGFGNLFREPLRDIITRTNRSSYVATVRAGGGFKALHDVIPRQRTADDVWQLLRFLLAADRRVRAAHR